MKDPQGLPNFIVAVLRMESSAFCKVVSDARGVDDRSNALGDKMVGRILEQVPMLRVMSGCEVKREC